MRIFTFLLPLIFFAVTVSADAQVQTLSSAALSDLAAGLEAQYRAALMRDRRLADERELATIADAEARMRTARDGLAAAVADRAAAETALVSARADYVRLIDESLRRRAIALIEAEAFRAEIEARLPEATPELLAAYREFADGARQDAFRVVEPLLEARIAARTTAARVVAGAEIRQLASLREIMRINGEASANDVLVLWNQAAELDPQDFWTQISRSRLFQLLSQLDMALAAARQASGASGDLRERSVANGEIGDILVRMGDDAGALTAFQSALSADRDLVAAHPNELEYARDLAIDLNRVGTLLMESSGDLAAAAAHYSEGLQLSRQIAAARPSPVAHADVAVDLDRLGNVALAQNDLATALGYYSEALEIDRRVLQADPRNIGHMEAAIIAYQRIAEIHRRRSDLGAALQNLADALSIARRAAASDPANVELARLAPGTLDLIGNVRSSMMDWDGARANYDEALSITRRLAAAAPDNPERLRDLMLALGKMGMAYAGPQRFDEAMPYLVEALSMARRQYAANPQAFDATHDLALQLSQVGMVRATRGDFETAWADITQSVDLLEQLRTRNPDNAAVLEPLAHGLLYRGGLRGERGEVQEGLADMERARDILERLQTEDGNAVRQQALEMVRAALAQFDAQNSPAPSTPKRGVR